MDVITAHLNADFDCLGAMVAALRLYPGALLTFSGSQEKGVRDFIAQHPDYLPPLARAKEIDLDKVSRLVIVDCQQAERIGRFGQIIGRPGLEVHIYDHHPVTADSIRPTGGVIRPCGAVSTIMAGLLRERGIALTAEEATLVMLGIYEDTGRLLFQPTTSDDYLAAAWLLEQGARLNIVANSISQDLTSQQVSLLNTLLKSLKTTAVNGVKISIAHAASDSYIPDIAILAHLMRDMENLDALFLVVAMEKRIYLVARSRVPEVDTGEILRHFHGGGHASAASATVHDLSLKQVLEKLEELLRIAVSPRVSARDLMSSPVKTMPIGITIAEARELLTRYNCNAMPVMAGERMVGIISRRIVEKALYHDLGEAPVTDFMHTEFLRGEPSTLLADIQAYMVEGNRRFVPVFEGAQLVGAVTRTDLLRHMYGGRREEPEALYDREALTPAPKLRSIAGQIERRLPPATIALLRELGSTADDLGLSVYAVGGFVRDLLLGVENLDVDVTVEGDGIFFAERFAAGHGFRVRSHPAFATAVVIRPDGAKLDVASTRLEFYESPGMLPTVERSSLRHDLYRRDFTINTLAFCLNGDRFGLLTDFFGGQQDIQERVVRVLHNLSFVEDPTRVFRAIRFEQRLGFHIAPHTENLMRGAVRMNVLDKVGGTRLLNELILILREREPTGTIMRMASLGLLPSIHPSLKLTPETERTVREAAQVLAWFRLLYLEDHCEQWQVYFLSLCDRLKHEEFGEICSRLAIPGRVVTRILGHRRRALGLLDALQRRLKHGPPVRNSEIYSCFHDLPLEILLYLAARTRYENVRRCVTLYITRLRLVRCDLDGTSLLALGLKPGPRVGEILAHLLATRLDGEISTPEEERRLAMDLILRQSAD
ncbi:CBS domain-containing protein [Geobacter sp. SVR]|uniref:CBS domain-containing protein n=1 Tax=Geobacter sp. SVR TaxID=2495594 RepID=UPI00143F0463|nr:CBS domain-containing protein [Geobacter sp. SVR]BCS52272.1 poly(A) polymerase [Geobacter sp. SVR]GCF85067.1 poly(A) polymerase [Geobacter sp. SVR]